MSLPFPFGIRIFDSRFWNAVLPPQGEIYDGYIAKATEYVGGEYWTNPLLRTQYEAAGRYFEDRRGAWSFHRVAAEPVTAARSYHQAMLNVGGYGRIPPVLDLEDIRAPASLRSVDHMWAQLQEMEQLAGREVLCYTAAWIWNRWAPYVQSRHGFYDRMLWEADPPPDTPEPGKWPKSKLVAVQVRLDFNPGGFNAVIDESIVDPIWWAGLTGGEPVLSLEERVKRLEAQAHSHG